jgi:tetratricopeptide (TPR) repeat protein
MAERSGHETGAALEPQMKDLARSNQSSLREQTLQVVASNEALSRVLGSKFNNLENTLQWGLNEVADSVQALAADFSYGVSLLVAEFQIQNRTLNNVLASLDRIHETLRTPVQTRAQEYFREGYRFLGQKLLTEALDYLKRGLEEYDVDFLAHYHLGLLYLNGQDEDDDVIDLPEAEIHLRLAARYAIPLVDQLQDWKGQQEVSRYCGEAFFHASVACYAQAGELRRTGNPEQAQKKLKEAVDLALQSIRAYPIIGEAHYHHAKYRALLGEAKETAEALYWAILSDYRYLLKASVDTDFELVREPLDAFSEVMRGEARRVAEEATLQIEGWQQELRELFASGVWPQPRTERLTAALEEQHLKMQRHVEKATYFDYQEALEVFHSLWNSEGRVLLREALGESLASHIEKWTSSVPSEHGGLELRLRDQSLHSVLASYWSFFQKHRTLWTPELLEHETSLASRVIAMMKEFMTEAPDQERPIFERQIQEISRDVERSTPPNVLSAVPKLRSLLEQSFHVSQQHHEREVGSLREEASVVEERRKKLGEETSKRSYWGWSLIFWLIIGGPVLGLIVGSLLEGPMGLGDDSVVAGVILIVLYIGPAVALAVLFVRKSLARSHMRNSLVYANQRATEISSAVQEKEHHLIEHARQYQNIREMLRP